MSKLPYDNTNIKDIVRYANELIGMTFRDVLDRVFSENSVHEEREYYNNPKGKGSLGNLLEEHYFLYKPNSESAPDFDKVGMELKVTPYENSKIGIKAGERLVITMISNEKPIEIDFKGSHLEQKLRLILMIWYNRIKSMPRTEYSIDYVNLYDLYSKICEKDLEIILEDYKIIVDKIISGNAHKISEGDTRYLGACTKGASASKILQPQYYNKAVPAKRRAFSLKQSYMTYVLNNYVAQGLMNYESIFSKDEIVGGDFDNKVIKKINKYVGKTDKELYEIFNVGSLAKSRNSAVIYRMLGVKTDSAEEFEKANIFVKTIRIDKKGMPKENIQLNDIDIMEFVGNDFEDSEEYDFFETTRFLFVVFEEDNEGNHILRGSKFWNMPIEDLDEVVKKEWDSYKQKFLSGVKFYITKTQNGGLIVKNDLPKSSETEIFHLRPHARNTAYVIDGIKYGKGDESDMDNLPNGDKMTHQCFWLNKEYVAKIIKEIIH